MVLRGGWVSVKSEANRAFQDKEMIQQSMWLCCDTSTCMAQWESLRGGEGRALG